MHASMHTWDLCAFFGIVSLCNDTWPGCVEILIARVILTLSLVQEMWITVSQPVCYLPWHTAQYSNESHKQLGTHITVYFRFHLIWLQYSVIILLTKGVKHKFSMPCTIATTLFGYSSWQFCDLLYCGTESGACFVRLEGKDLPQTQSYQKTEIQQPLLNRHKHISVFIDFPIVHKFTHEKRLLLQWSVQIESQ